MSKHRSKPVEIEAVELTPQRLEEWFKNAGRWPNGIEVIYLTSKTVLCRSRQGVVRADLGDWIIQESDGSGCYPCKPDVFAAKYEPV